jgi:hypothetical protein
MVFLTSKRKFHCRNCDAEFRAPDRRQTPRNPREVDGAVRAS